MQVEFFKKCISEINFKNFFSTEKAGKHQASCNPGIDSSPISALLQDACCMIFLIYGILLKYNHLYNT